MDGEPDSGMTMVYSSGKEIWRGTGEEWQALCARMGNATVTLSNNHGKVCAAGMKPDTEYLIVEA